MGFDQFKRDNPQEAEKMESHWSHEAAMQAQKQPTIEPLRAHSQKTLLQLFNEAGIEAVRARLEQEIRRSYTEELDRLNMKIIRLESEANSLGSGHDRETKELKRQNANLRCAVQIAKNSLDGIF